MKRGVLDTLEEWIRVTGKLVDLIEEESEQEEDAALEQHPEKKDPAPEVKEAPKPEPKKEEPKKSVAASKQQKPTGRQKLQLDEGKMSALYKAGWSVTDIADEMGVSTMTINSRLKKMGVKE